MSRKSSGEKATIFEVADLAGVSIKTVSRVVNNEPNVRDATREKVLNAVKRLNYQPNTAARVLSGKRSYVIGLLYENPEEFSYVGAVLNAVVQACEAEGYSLLLRPLTLPDADLGEQVRQFAVQARVDGMVLPAPIGDIEEVRQALEELGVPYAVITPRVDGEEAVSIHCDDEHAVFELTEYMIGQGHEIIGFIKGHPDHAASARRYAGYRAALKKHGIAYEARLVRQGYFDFESGKRCAARLLDLEVRPSVILASNDDMAAGVMFEARERGLSIPEDLSVVGFDDTPLASHVWPALATVRQPISEMADVATRLLIARLRGEECDSTRSFECSLVMRASAGPAR